jgi:hypothetical protein
VKIPQTHSIINDTLKSLISTTSFQPIAWGWIRHPSEVVRLKYPLSRTSYEQEGAFLEAAD